VKLSPLVFCFFDLLHYHLPICRCDELLARSSCCASFALAHTKPFAERQSRLAVTAVHAHVS
jgi:hypothetical protein